MHRFHVPELPGEGEVCALPDDEARHLTQVLRLGVGDLIRVFDGRGREHLAQVTDAGRGSASVCVGRAEAPAPEPAVQITLAAAVLKGEKFDAVIRDAAMLGAFSIQPLVTARSDVPAARAMAAHRSGRWQRISASSAKQCGRAVVPLVAPPVALDAGLPMLPPPLLLLAEPSADTPAAAIPPRPMQAAILTGPEGGWTSDEIEAARRAGALCLRLGARTLRADAAPLVALAVLLHHWNAN